VTLLRFCSTSIHVSSPVPRMPSTSHHAQSQRALHRHREEETEIIFFSKVISKPLCNGGNLFLMRPKRRNGPCHGAGNRQRWMHWGWQNCPVASPSPGTQPWKAASIGHGCCSAGSPGDSTPHLPLSSRMSLKYFPQKRIYAAAGLHFFLLLFIYLFCLIVSLGLIGSNIFPPTCAFVSCCLKRKLGFLGRMQALSIHKLKNSTVYLIEE